jgi:hypothetical protein
MSWQPEPSPGQPCWELAHFGRLVGAALHERLFKPLMSAPGDDAAARSALEQVPALPLAWSPEDVTLASSSPSGGVWDAPESANADRGGGGPARLRRVEQSIAPPPVGHEDRARPVNGLRRANASQPQRDDDRSPHAFLVLWKLSHPARIAGAKTRSYQDGAVFWLRYFLNAA